MSANHGGSLENALKIVRQAAGAGADCLKIQTYTADSITINCDSVDFMIHGGLWDGYKLYDLYTDAGTPYEWQAKINEECTKCGMDFISTPFDNVAVVAVSMVACVVEKHVKLEGVESADSKFSMSMDEFAEMVKVVRDAKLIAGNVQYGSTEREQGNLKFRHSLFAVKDIKAGEKITAENVRSVRPSTDMKPKMMLSIHLRIEGR